MPASWKMRWCLFASVDLRGPLPIELRDQAAAPGDGIVAEPVPHRIHRLVDLATEWAGTAEQVALKNLAGLDEIMGADADSGGRNARRPRGQGEVRRSETSPQPIAWRSSDDERG